MIAKMQGNEARRVTRGFSFFGWEVVWQDYLIGTPGDIYRWFYNRAQFCCADDFFGVFDAKLLNWYDEQGWQVRFDILHSRLYRVLPSQFMVELYAYRPGMDFGFHGETWCMPDRYFKVDPDGVREVL